MERSSDLRRDPPGNSYKPQKGPRGQRRWGATKLEGSVGQNKEVKRGVRSLPLGAIQRVLGMLVETRGLSY